MGDESLFDRVARFHDYEQENYAMMFFNTKINPVRELRPLTGMRDGGIKPPSALYGNNNRLKSVVFSNGINSPIGRIILVWQREKTTKLIRLILPSERFLLSTHRYTRGKDRSIDQLINAIHGYFDGSRKRLPLDRLDWSVCSTFQQKVLKHEWLIPYGKVSSYQNLAGSVRDTRCRRAVGSALARNPFPIIIPCHRTVRSDLSLGGYRGGLKLKRWLLEHEGVEFDASARILKKFFRD
ncbi:hypothetical protein A2Y85_05325 [candidate division WOR-3 bacterium RBG_13_43_14]|uniref:methylated-DNA--[protein]-cysteine S-methyltransferase n=1 Tax=candidate division WOR-3 bacterium RBG_13_43_14 TaxID=1802590 RepID=A0A1F4U1I1_UNCW3|nr:MAG: hypothetical protein A2Y85_05325 [candidate division WOR-3 bacterium RBG_13_43_14]